MQNFTLVNSNFRLFELFYISPEGSSYQESTVASSTNYDIFMFSV